MKERMWQLRHRKQQETWQWIELVGESIFWPHAPNNPRRGETEPIRSINTLINLATILAGIKEIIIV